MVLLIFSTAYYFVLGAQVNYQLDSPLIPTQIKNANAHPLFVRGAVLGLFSCAGVILFFYKRYYLLMAIAVLALVGDTLI